MKRNLGRWSGTFEPRPDDLTAVDESVVEEVWRNDYRLDLAEGFRGATVLDIGANIGAFSVLAALAGAGTVIAVEPESGNRARLEHHLAMNGVADRVVVIPLAVVGEHGPAHVRVEGTGGGAFTSPQRRVMAERVDIETISLGELVNQYGPIAFAKVDCEGAEFEMFADLAPGTLKKIDRIALEWHGPAMPHLGHLAIAPPDAVALAGYDETFAASWWNFGRLVTTLADTGRVETFGHPSRGGLIQWQRYR